MFRLAMLWMTAGMMALVWGCGDASRSSLLPMHWQPIDSLNIRLPAGIRAFAGQNDSLPLRAWYVEIDEPHPAIATRVVLASDTTDNRETVSDFAQSSVPSHGPQRAVVAINGGYFTMNKTPAEHVGLLCIDGKVIEPATRLVWRDSLRYFTARVALGFTPDDRIDIAWVLSRGDTLFALDAPLPNRSGSPAPAADRSAARPWLMRDAIGAGPALIMDGRIRITADEEVFFGTSIPRVHPRTAAGYTREGKLILLVVDGRQPESRGVNLAQLATLMAELGCVEALNLDGGGSSTLVVAGTRLNRPAGGDVERQVMSALVVFVENEDR